MMGIVLFGVTDYRALPVSDVPNVDFPTIQVNPQLPGAPPAHWQPNPPTFQPGRPADPQPLA
jgi:multidrug efflux pump subunit AcrB